MGFFGRVAALLRGWRAASTTTSTPLETRLSRSRPLFRRDQVAMLQAFEDHAHLHSVVRGRSEAASAVCWQVFEAKPGVRADDLDLLHLRGREYALAVADLQKAGDLVPQRRSPLLKLLRRPSPQMSGPDFWELQCNYDMLLGEFLWLKGGRVGGRPTKLHSVVPSWLQSWPDAGSDHFVIQATGGRIEAPAADVIWRRRLSPRDPLGSRGLGTAYALRDETELDELLAEMARSRAANKNYPDYLIALLAQPGVVGSTAPGAAQVEIVKKMLEQGHGGPARAGMAHILAGDFKAQALGHTLVESQYIDTRRFNRDTHLQTFHQPPELAGVLDNANRSTIAASEDLEARRAIVPLYERWRCAIQDELAPEFGDNVVVGYLSPIPADREYRGGMLKALPASATLNEIRAEQGLPPRPDGDTYYKAPGAVPVAGSPSSPTTEEKKT